MADGLASRYVLVLQVEYSDGTKAGTEMEKDELTHAAFWKLMEFEDPTPADKQVDFALCGARCGSALHDDAADKGKKACHATVVSLKLWEFLVVWL